MEELIQRIAKALTASKKTVALTGAGISVESGIPPFRGKGGLWEKIDPMEYAHIDAFMEDPKKVWEGLIKETQEFIEKARPNDAHLGLARLEKMGMLKSIITQNIDGLHQAAGNLDVIEFHGSFAWHYCLDCGRKTAASDMDVTRLPPRCDCGGIFRPDCVFFGEMIPPDHLSRSRRLAASCDVMLVVGTSAIVHPAAMMPVIASENNAMVVEINMEETPLTGEVSDFIITGPAGDIFNRIMAELEAGR